MVTGCPRQRPAPRCSSGLANATREDLHETLRPGTLSPGHDKVSERQQAEKPRRVLEPGLLLRSSQGRMLLRTEAALGPLGVGVYKGQNKVVFFPPERNALLFF